MVYDRIFFPQISPQPLIYDYHERCHFHFVIIVSNSTITTTKTTANATAIATTGNLQPTSILTSHVSICYVPQEWSSLYKCIWYVMYIMWCILILWHKNAPYTQFWYVWVCLGVLTCFQFFQDPVISCIQSNQRSESESRPVLKYRTWMIIHNDSSDSGENWGPLFINLYTPQEN